MQCELVLACRSGLFVPGKTGFETPSNKTPRRAKLTDAVLEEANWEVSADSKDRPESSGIYAASELTFRSNPKECNSR